MINKKSVNIFIEKIIPSCSKKVKTVSKELKQESNISKIYTNKSNISPENINSNYYIQEEAAPFARRLLNPDRFNMVSGTTKTLEAIETTRKDISQIKDLKTRDTFELLYSRITNETSNIENLSNGIRELIQKVEMIDNPETKEIILSEIQTLASRNKKGFKNNFHNKMEFVESLTDAVNIMNGRYANIKSEPLEFYKWLDKKNSWFADVIDGKKGTPENYRDCYAQKKGKINYDEYLEWFDSFSDSQLPEVHQNNIKLEAFRKLVEKYRYFEPKIIQKLYQTEYLPKLSPDVQKIFKQINKDYGTIIITSNPQTNALDAKYIEEEFRLWKEAGKNKAILPEFLDINMLNKHLQETSCSGAALVPFKQISVKNLLDIDTFYLDKSDATLRHEINHLNDRNMKPKNSFEDLYDFLNWNINKILHKKEWQKELKHAGISDEGIDYAMTNMEELKSVTAESFMDRLSEKYKKQLIKKFNMENWIFNIDDNFIREDEVIRKLKS